MGLHWASWSLLPSTHSLTLFGVFVTVFALLFDFMMRRRSWSRYPPGPTSLPFIGNLAQVDYKNLPGYYAQLSKRFGDVFSVQFCWTNVVVLNGFEAVKEGLINKAEDTSDRPVFLFTEEFGYKENCEGVIIAKYGPSWRELRRFTLSTLRNFGVGKKSLEERVQEEARCLCSEFKPREGHPFNPRIMITNAVSNVICAIVFGDRFEYDDKNFQKVLPLFADLVKINSDFVGQVLSLAPGLIRIPGFARKAIKNQEDFFTFLQKIINEHKNTRDPNVTRDFIDAFLDEIEKVKPDSVSCFSETNILLTTFDLFIAGTETTSSTLRWALLYMILYPDIQTKTHQERVQEEIDQVIGRDRQPSMSDRSNMPYTNAVIHEVQRMGDIVPFSVFHRTSKDTEINGFFIPKGVTIMPNLSSVLKDASIWEKPHQFYPEHFLDTNGKFVKPDAFIPFSTGRRICLGEPLARMELFLFFTSFLQKFNFSIPRDQPRPSEDAKVGTLRVPHNYELCVNLR